MEEKINEEIKFITRNRKVKPVALKFLYEFAAIPRETRQKYLDKLLRCPVTGTKRKNADKRKNIKMLKVIYHYIENGDMLGWDEEKICRMLDISVNMLYCHKSRLLKGLREFHFNWKEIEEKEFRTESKYEPDSLDTLFAKAEKMFEIGMRKEAKVIFQGIERRLRNKKRSTTGEKLKLIKICYYLCSYYNANKKKTPLLKYYHKAEDLSNKLKHKDRHIQNEAMLNYLYCRLFKISENFKSEDVGIKEVQLFKEIYRLSIKLKDVNRQAEVLLDMSAVCKSIRKHEIAGDYIKKGIALCRSHGMKEKEIVFRAILLSNNLLSGKVDALTSEKNFVRLYKNFKGYNIEFFWRINFLFQAFQISSHWYDKTHFHYFAQIFNAEKINGIGIDSSYRSLYFLKLDYYTRMMRIPSIEKDENSGKKYISFSKSDEMWYRKLENTFDEILLNFNRLKNIFLINEIYLFMLLAESYRGIKCDFNKANNFIQKLDYLYKTRNKLLHTKPTFESIKFQIRLLKDADIMSRKNFLDKYEHEFFTLAEEHVNEDKPNVEDSYPIFSFIAGQTGYPELKEIAKKLYWKLEEKHPGIFDPMKQRIKSKEELDEGLVEMVAA